MVKTTDATQIRKAFGAVSLQGKQAWNDDGLGKIHCASLQRDKLEDGLKTIEALGWDKVSEEETPQGSRRYRFRKNGTDGSGADLTVHALVGTPIGIFASYRAMDRTWCGI